MKKQLILLLVTLFSVAALYAQTTNEKIHYTGYNEEVNFDYYSNWEFEDGYSWITMRPDGANNFIEIHWDDLTVTEAEKIEELKADNIILTPAVFNKMNAYKASARSYFIFKNNRCYNLVWGVTGTTYAKQIDETIRSFSIK